MMSIGVILRSSWVIALLLQSIGAREDFDRVLRLARGQLCAALFGQFAGALHDVLGSERTVRREMSESVTDGEAHGGLANFHRPLMGVLENAERAAMARAAFNP